MHQRKREVRCFAETSDLFDVAADFAHTAFRQTTNIVLTRDPRDVYCAARGQWFSSDADVLQRLRRAADRMRWFGRVHRDETIFIEFEDLLTASDQVLGEVWNTLGLSPGNWRFNEDAIGLAEAREAAGLGRGGRNSIARKSPALSWSSGIICDCLTTICPLG